MRQHRRARRGLLEQHRVAGASSREPADASLSERHARAHLATQIPNSPGLTFQGNLSLANPSTFGDGVRCCGQSVVRWITIGAVGNCASTNQPAGCGNQIGGLGGPISQHPMNSGLMAGDSRCYQHWYRDPGGNNPCGVEFFNLTNGYSVTWGV